MNRVVKLFLLFGGIYILIDGLLHLLNLRLTSVINVWPDSALLYAKLLNVLYASFAILVATVAILVQKDTDKNKTLIVGSAFWALLHGLLLIGLSLTQNYIQIFKTYPSLHLFFPMYDKFLIFEGVLLLVYSLVVFIWWRGKR